ncbi:unnamed protein product [Discula destructiva]
MANSDSPPPPSDLGSGAKIGVAIASAFGILGLFALGLWMWWRRRQRRQMAKEMVNFVDGDIVNLVDGGRFEKPFNKPAGAYDPYYHGNSSSSVSASPVYFQTPTHFTEPPIEQPPSTYNEPPSTSYNQYYAPAAPAPSLPPSRDMPTAAHVHSIPPSLPPATETESHAWSSATRHPWSPPDYDAHSPAPELNVLGDAAFHATHRQPQPVPSGDDRSHYPVLSLPAILPEPRPEPQAELPARDIRGQGGELEMPAPEQQPPRRHEEIDEQKFLLSDVLMIRQQKSRPSVRRSPPG